MQPVVRVHADTNAWAIPFPAYCDGLRGGCLSPGEETWVGGADVSPDRGTSGVRVTIGFTTSTNPANIQSDNDLGAGIATYAGCGSLCPLPYSVDYVYYGFVDLSHSGRIRFDSSGWFTCEWGYCPSFISNTPKDCITAENGWNTCPDSYHSQLFHDSWTCSDCTSLADDFLVEMTWSGGSAIWNYYKTCPIAYWCLEHTFSNTPPSSWPAGAVGAYFKTGTGQTSCYISPCSPQWYHFQFGTSALYNIGQGGWSATFDDPEYLSNDCNSGYLSWCLVPNAQAFDGYSSYFDNTYALGGKVFTGGTPTTAGNFNGVTPNGASAYGCSSGVAFQWTGNSPIDQDGMNLWTNAGTGCSFAQDLSSVSASPNSVPADGVSTSTITAQLPASEPNIQIHFFTTLGGLSSSTCTTAGNGACSVTITSTNTGTATISATPCFEGNCASTETSVTFTVRPTTIEIYTYPTTDIYCRSIGLAIDQPLPVPWWPPYQSGYEIGTPSSQGGNCRSLTYYTYPQLAAGSHYVQVAVSGYVPNYAWHAIVYVNGAQIAQGDVGRNQILQANFNI